MGMRAHVTTETYLQVIFFEVCIACAFSRLWDGIHNTRCKKII